MQTQTNTPENSLKGVMEAFGNLLTKEQEMNQLEGDAYYKAQEAFKEDLKVFLRLRFIWLSTRELLKLISMVSTHRPVAPHSFLITCANLINE